MNTSDLLKRASRIPPLAIPHVVGLNPNNAQAFPASDDERALVAEIIRICGAVAGGTDAVTLDWIAAMPWEIERCLYHEAKIGNAARFSLWNTAISEWKKELGDPWAIMLHYEGSIVSLDEYAVWIAMARNRAGARIIGYNAPAQNWPHAFDHGSCSLYARSGETDRVWFEVQRLQHPDVKSWFPHLSLIGAYMPIAGGHHWNREYRPDDSALKEKARVVRGSGAVGMWLYPVPRTREEFEAFCVSLVRYAEFWTA